MSPQTLRLIMMFFLAVAVLSLTNYLFYLLYDLPSHKAVKVSVSFKMPKSRQFYTKSLVTRTVKWTDSLVCEKGNHNNKSAKSEGSVEEDVLIDYRDQSTETNSLYYYNGLRRGLDMCAEEPSGLGPIKPNDFIDLDAIENLYSVLQPGGIYEESECMPRQIVAIIVPYGDDKSQLTKFLYSLHPILIKQQLEYQIFVIEQANKSQPLNLGKLFNVGFTEAQRMKKNGAWNCIIYHQHDLVPADSRNLYRCKEQPEQLVLTLTGNNSFEYSVGGVLGMKPHVFLKVNGFSNLYVRNKAVYADLFKRLINVNFTITRRNATISKYTLLTATIKENNSVAEYETIQTSSPLNLLDGLTTLTYTLINIELKPLYTLIKVDLDKESNQSQATISERLWDRLLNHATSS